MTKFARRASLSALLASVSVIAAVSLRAEPPQQGGGVMVDFIASTANGQPVTDLKPTDVAIRVGGRQRTIASLEFKSNASAGGGAAAPASALPPPFYENGGSGGGAGRRLLIIIDNESLKVGTERAVRESLDQVLGQMGPNDRAAFAVAPKDTMGLGFNAGVPAVRAALAKYAGIRPASVSTTENQCRSRDSLQMIRGMIDAMAGSETPTSVLYIASGLALAGTLNRGGDNVSCEVLTEHYTNIGTAAAQARVNFYVAQGDEGITGRDDGLENLAGVTGAGAVLRATPGGLTKITNDLSGYWVATLQPESSDRPGATAKLEVRVNREGVVTRARPDVALSGRRADTRSLGTKASPRDMIASTAPFGDLPLRVYPVVSRLPGGRLAIATMTETSDPAAKITALSAAIFPIGQNKAATSGSADEKQIAGKPILLSLAVDPGKYRVRVAATDANGRAGAVDMEVSAALADAGPIKLGGMLLLAPRGESFAPQLVFSDEAEIVPYVELYFDPATVKLEGAAIDIAASADGPALVTGMPGGQPTNEPDKFIINGKVPFAKLAPGDYVVRVTVKAAGGPEGKVTRTIRKIAK